MDEAKQKVTSRQMWRVFKSPHVPCKQGKPRENRKRSIQFMWHLLIGSNMVRFRVNMESLGN